MSDKAKNRVKKCRKPDRRKPEAKPGDGHFGAIHAKSITLTAGDGKASVHIEALAKGVGLWVSSGDGNECLCLVAGFGDGNYLGFHGPDTSAEVACPVAVTREGVQLADGKAFRFVTLPQLLALAGKEPR